MPEGDELEVEPDLDFELDGEWAEAWADRSYCRTSEDGVVPARARA